jgi:predicted phage replisome organizer
VPTHFKRYAFVLGSKEMSKVKYIKLTSNIFETKHIKKIEKLNNGDTLIALWLKLLTKSKLKNSYGYLVFNVANIELTDDKLTAIFRYKNIRELLDTLEKHGFIKREQKSILVIPWWCPRRDRNSQRYREWRQRVLVRDNFTCQGCGTKKELQAHHIVHWKDCGDNDDLRYSTENGITLCKKCHLEAHGGNWRG